MAYDVGQLTQALITKGGYNPTDAANAAQNKGGRADELAKEFLGYSGDSSMSTQSVDSDLPGYLQSFQETAMKSLSELKPPEVPTFEKLKNNLTPDTPAPTPINRVATREALRTSLGVADLETELNTIKTEETRITDELRALTGSEEGKPVALNVISGRISEEERVAQQRLDAVIRQKNSVINELNTKYNVINTYVQDLGLDYQDAVEAYNTDFERNYKIQSMVTDMANTSFDQRLNILKTGWDMTMDTVQLQQQIKQQNIDNARANLSTMVNAITSGNMTYDGMSSDQKLQVQKLEIQSGMPVGTIASMGLSTKDKILAFSGDNSQAIIAGPNGTLQTISTGIAPKTSGGGTSGLTASQKSALDADIAKRMTLESLLNKYNTISPNLVFAEYNEKSPYGPSKPELDAGLYKKYNITAATSPTKTTVSNADINKAIQLARKNGATDEEIQQIQSNPGAYVNDIISLYGD